VWVCVGGWVCVCGCVWVGGWVGVVQTGEALIRNSKHLYVYHNNRHNVSQ
jgi:hypothetical protein